MIERVCLRRRLASATYHPWSPLEGNESSNEQYADQKIAVFTENPSSNQGLRDEDVCRHVASKQSTGLPFFVMSLPRLINSLHQWRSKMPRVRAFYSLRCNADPVLTRLLAEQDDIGFEAQDPVLLETALSLVPSERILYSNPCLTRKTLRHADQVQVGMMTIESENDLLNAFTYAPNAKLLIRVCMSSHLHCLSEDIETRFGCSFNEARDILLTASELRAKVIGISFNLGAGDHDPSVYYKAIRSAKELIDEGKRMGVELNTLCLGGGFSSNQKTHFDEMSDVIGCALDDYFPRSGHFEILATPGRFFAGPAFNLCTSVIGKKTIEAKMITNDDFDEGPGYVYQTNEGIYGSFGCRLMDNCEPKCRPLDDLPHHYDLFHATVLGPNVDGSDVAQPRAFLPQLAVGEWLFWENMGAYSMPHDLESPGLPVYYFDSRKSWDSRNTEKSLHRIDSASSTFVDSLDSVAGSEPSSDIEEEGEEDEDQDNLSKCFQRFFYHDFNHSSN